MGPGLCHYFEYDDAELESIGVDRSTNRLALGYANDHLQVIDDLDRALSGELGRQRGSRCRESRRGRQPTQPSRPVAATALPTTSARRPDRR